MLSRVDPVAYDISFNEYFKMEVEDFIETLESEDYVKIGDYEIKFVEE